MESEAIYYVHISHPSCILQGSARSMSSTPLYGLRRHQFQRSKTTFGGARNLSNHAKASSKPLFANLKILDVFSIYSLQVSSFMYLYHNDALPISFTQIFQTGNQTHQYSTRYSDFYRPQTCRTNIKKISIRSQGPRIWNSLPNNIKNAPTFNIFKRVIEPFLRVRQDTT